MCVCVCVCVCVLSFNVAGAGNMPLRTHIQVGIILDSRMIENYDDFRG